MTTFHLDQLVWVHETGCINKDDIQTGGYTLRGMTLVHIRFIVGGKVLCIVAIPCDGLGGLEATTTTVDAQIFFDFMHGSLIPNMLWVQSLLCSSDG